MAPNLNDSYSKIINPEQYNKLMSEQHLYISSADKFICNIIKTKATSTPLEVVELGCGPARVLSRLSDIESINLTGIDVDQQFLDYGKDSLKGTSTKVFYGDASTYNHVKPVDVFYSQGFHHHISKGEQTQKYLKNIYQQLAPDGCYILSDEFIPDYESESERKLKLVIWYAHIISHALKHNFSYLAQEEAKTLLDDLNEGTENNCIKTQEQISFVLSKVNEINQLAIEKKQASATLKANDFLNELKERISTSLNHDDTLDLSRGDFKICGKVLRQEVEDNGFTLESFKHFGPANTIGSMTIYIFRKDKIT